MMIINAWTSNLIQSTSDLHQRLLSTACLKASGQTRASRARSKPGFLLYQVDRASARGSGSPGRLPAGWKTRLGSSPEDRICSRGAEATSNCHHVEPDQPRLESAFTASVTPRARGRDRWLDCSGVCSARYQLHNQRPLMNPEAFRRLSE